jgi:hypothetical protein
MRVSQISSAIESIIKATNPKGHSGHIKLLAEILRSEPSLAIFDHVQCLPSSRSRLGYEGLAYWLAERAEKVGSTQAIEDLKRYITEPLIPYHEVMALGNINVKESVELANGIKLVPFAEVPDSTWKEDISEGYKQFPPSFQPSAGLLHLRSFKRIHVPAGQPFPRFSEDLYEGVDDARLVLTLGGPSAPVNLGSWDELSPWVPQRGSSAAIKLPLNMGGRFEKKNYDWSKAKPIHEKWVRLSAKEKRHLRVPLQRLNTAMRRGHGVDSAIDLGIALEAVFLSDREPDRGELGFTLRVRAARLLKADRDSRQELSRFMRMLYEIRSSAVHTGEILEVIGGMRVHRILEKGYLLTAQAIEHIIMNGEPDWQAIVFS